MTKGNNPEYIRIFECFSGYRPMVRPTLPVDVSNNDQSIIIGQAEFISHKESIAKID